MTKRGSLTAKNNKTLEEAARLATVEESKGTDDDNSNVKKNRPRKLRFKNVNF